MKSYTNILVTGGCGFIGSNFIRRLYRNYPHYRITNLDALTYAGNPENLSDIESKEAGLGDEQRKYRFVRGDICDTVLLDGLFRQGKFDLVVHFAAETHVDRSHFEVADFIRTNIEGTRCLVETFRKFRVPRFVHISTDEVYGSIAHGASAHEESPFRPSNLYSTSKAGGDMLVQSMMKVYNIPAVIVRGSNNFGPFQYPEKLIPLTISNMIEGVKIPIHGSGEHVRSWLHVEDFCSAVDMIAHCAPDHAIYNVSGDERTNLEVIGMVAKTLGKNIDEYRHHRPDRPNADLRYAPDSTKLQRDLGWSRSHQIEDSIAAVVAWYAHNEEWWRKIKKSSAFLDYYSKQANAEWDAPSRLE
ncbi:MAG: dTDP-glucose 4,6-dehydratase [bacterium]|nr:dTDP-glucose 4,6-dehydratase [bacterium]